jgi:DNA-binding LytR/AlgR family response regulator
VKSGQEFFVATTLGMIAARFDEKVFVRTHRSFLINIHYLKYFEGEKGKYAFLENNLRVNVSRRKRQNLIEKVENLSKK